MDKKRAKTKDDYSKIAGLYFEDFGNDFDNFEAVDLFIELLKRRHLENREILDLGSGPGNYIKYLYDNNLKNITAVEFVPEFCEILKERFKDNSLKIVKEEMLTYLKTLDANSVGSIIAGFSIIHIPDEEVDELFKEIKRILVKNGLFLMSGHKGTFKGFEEEPYLTSQDPRLKVSEKLETYTNYFTEEELKERIEKVGLKIFKIFTFKPIVRAGDIPVDKIFVITENND
ncbi:MAG: methyltransferase domain-containing protein [Candidatus Dojkabacteria bacterium]